ncbi:uncharacterized protein LOC130700329 [Daphnia carinata]|uniref:uncharacterized protein LOC130700329 n=1 Tax=Daphnia carinata TaxID=120202 RepID=UPI00257EC490|nr:uncharacterized protein LOC130700329 [Daphnia carinata]
MTSVPVEKSKSSAPLKSKKKAVSKTSKQCVKNKDNCILIRYRHRKLPSRDEIRLLHPNIIDVRTPRQKTAKFCQLEFESKEAAIDALRKLRKTQTEELALIQYLGKKTPSKPPTKEENQSESNTSDDYCEEETSVTAEEVLEDSEELLRCPCLLVSGLPDIAVTEVIKSLYPTNTKVEIGEKKLNGKRYALVHFGSTEEAVRVMEASKDVSVNGERLMVKFHK